jgi:hypothetical protein
MSANRSNRKGHEKWIAILGAIIGAAATIAAALIGRSAGVVYVGIGAQPTMHPTVPAAPSSAGTGPGSSADARAKIGPPTDQWMLTIPVPDDPNQYTGVMLAQGVVGQSSGASDIYYERSSTDNRPEIAFNQPYSVSLTAPNPTKGECQAAVNHSPGQGPLTDLQGGQYICVQIDSGIALLQIVQPPDTTGVVRIRDTYWA